jgi:hypothetical protein
LRLRSTKINGFLRICNTHSIKDKSGSAFYASKSQKTEKFSHFFDFRAPSLHFFKELKIFLFGEPPSDGAEPRGGWEYRARPASAVLISCLNF